MNWDSNITAKKCNAKMRFWFRLLSKKVSWPTLFIKGGCRKEVMVLLQVRKGDQVVYLYNWLRWDYCRNGTLQKWINNLRENKDRAFCLVTIDATFFYWLAVDPLRHFSWKPIIALLRVVFYNTIFGNNIV